MPRKVAISTLNASTYDILNVIRQNASAEYQSLVPEVSPETGVRVVGEVFRGYPAMANQFLSSLINRIALVRINSKLFNNAYSMFKKGFLEYGETVEEVFVNLVKAREFSVEKAADRELKRSVPDVRTAMHIMNYRVQYPVTIQDMDLHTAFLSEVGVQDLIAKIIDSIYSSANYDEFLLFKYLMIKGITSGKMYPVQFDNSDMHNAAKAFRGFSNVITFMKTEYNAEGVHTFTPRDDQYIFMSAEFNADFDVDVLASAFNMDKATFLGHLQLIDDWTTFDNDRFSEIVTNSDMIEPVTDDELALMANVSAVIVDAEWFQIYDNQARFTEKYVASGEYWNYFYNVWKTVSISPFSNALVFVTGSANITMPQTFTVHITDKSESDFATTLTLEVKTTDEQPAVFNQQFTFVQTEQMTRDGIAMHPYGAILIPEPEVTAATKITVKMNVGNASYTSATQIDATAEVDSTITMNKDA